MLQRDELPQHTQDELARILRLEPAARTEEENAFLRARRAYLNEEELANLPEKHRKAHRAAK